MAWGLRPPQYIPHAIWFYTVKFSPVILCAIMPYFTLHYMGRWVTPGHSPSAIGGIAITVATAGLTFLFVNLCINEKYGFRITSWIFGFPKGDIYYCLSSSHDKEHRFSIRLIRWRRRVLGVREAIIHYTLLPNGRACLHPLGETELENAENFIPSVLYYEWCPDTGEHEFIRNRRIDMLMEEAT